MSWLTAKLMRSFERAAVNPLVAGVPALDGGRVHELLPHNAGCRAERADCLARLRELVCAHELDGAGYEFGGAFHLLELRLLEEVGVEERFEDGADCAVVLEVCAD